MIDKKANPFVNYLFSVLRQKNLEIFEVFPL